MNSITSFYSQKDLCNTNLNSKINVIKDSNKKLDNRNNSQMDISAKIKDTDTFKNNLNCFMRKYNSQSNLANKK